MLCKGSRHFQFHPISAIAATSGRGSGMLERRQSTTLLCLYFHKAVIAPVSERVKTFRLRIVIRAVRGAWQVDVQTHDVDAQSGSIRKYGTFCNV